MELPQVDRITASRDPQVYDLRDTGASDMAEAGQFGVVSNLDMRGQRVRDAIVVKKAAKSGRGGGMVKSLRYWATHRW